MSRTGIDPRSVAIAAPPQGLLRSASLRKSNNPHFDAQRRPTCTWTCRGRGRVALRHDHVQVHSRLVDPIGGELTLPERSELVVSFSWALAAAERTQGGDGCPTAVTRPPCTQRRRSSPPLGRTIPAATASDLIARGVGRVYRTSQVPCVGCAPQVLLPSLQGVGRNSTNASSSRPPPRRADAPNPYTFASGSIDDSYYSLWSTRGPRCRRDHSARASTRPRRPHRAPICRPLLYRTRSRRSPRPQAGNSCSRARREEHVKGSIRARQGRPRTRRTPERLLMGSPSTAPSQITATRARAPTSPAVGRSLRGATAVYPLKEVQSSRR